MERADLERIARLALRELGEASARVTIEPLKTHPDQWQILVDGNRPARLTIKCGSGSTPQWVRTQIFDQYLAQS